MAPQVLVKFAVAKVAAMKLSVLDGAKSIGGTKLLLEDRGTTLLIDFGLNFGQFGKYYEEFVRPRACHGLRDLWEMDLVPKIGGVYRGDLAPGGWNPSPTRNIQVDALLLSHAHVDHTGCIGVLDPSIPIVGSAASAAIMKTMQDSGKSDFWAETAYAVPRAFSNSDPRALASAGTSVSSIGRQYLITDQTPTASLTNLWQAPANPSSRARQMISAPIKRFGGKVGNLEIAWHPVDHSIVGCGAFEIETEDGPVVYTGDLRLHGRRGEDTKRFIDHLCKHRPHLLIVEGTRLGRPANRNVTEADVLERARQIVLQNANRLVLADFGGRHVERLSAFYQIAREVGRSLVVTSKDAYLLEGLAAAGEADILADPTVKIFDEVHAVTGGWESALQQRHLGKYVSANDLEADQGCYLLCFSFFDVCELVGLDLKGACYIYSSSEAYGEDQRIDLWRLTNWAQRLGMTLYGFDWEGHGQTGRPVFNDSLNASGHISEADLSSMLKEVQAEFIVPVHTEQPDWFVETLKCTSSVVVFPDDDEGFVKCA